MLAIYRIDDPLALPGPRFFKLAYRLPHYQGVLRDRARAEIADEHAAAEAAAPAAVDPAPAEAGERVDNWAAFSLVTGIPVERVEVARSA